MNPTALTHLLDEAQRRRLTLFIGPDLPQAVTGLPSAGDLAAGLAKHLGLSGLGDAPALADVAQAAGRLRFRDTLQFLMDRLDSSGHDPQPVDLLLARLPVDLFITTRLDDGVGRAFEQGSRPAQALGSDVDARFGDRSKHTLV